MPNYIHDVRVFIASPSGLEAERELFKKRLERHNGLDPLDRNLIFTPIGYELTQAGAGRPQELINEDLRRCDYLVLMLHDRWGSPPGKDNDYSSGTEEEFRVAEECMADATKPMSNIFVMFKDVDSRQKADPGEQLKRVLEFREQLINDKKYLFKDFATDGQFSDYIDAALVRWEKQHPINIEDDRVDFLQAYKDARGQAPARQGGSAPASVQKKSINVTLSAAWYITQSDGSMGVLWTPLDVSTDKRWTSAHQQNPIKFKVSNNTNEAVAIKSLGFTLDDDTRLEIQRRLLIEDTDTLMQFPHVLAPQEEVSAIISFDELLFTQSTVVRHTTPLDDPPDTRSRDSLKRITGTFVQTRDDIFYGEDCFALQSVIDRAHNHRTQEASV